MGTLVRAAVSVLVLTVYVLVVAPVGLVVRLVRDPLRRRPDPGADSYWTYGDDGRAARARK